MTSLGLVHCDAQGLADLNASLADGGIPSIPSVKVRYEMNLERFDTTTGQFEVLPPPPTKRNLFNVQEARGKVVVVAGVDNHGDYVRAVEVFDPATATWKAGAEWPNPRDAFFVSVDGLVCAIGGTKGLDLAPKRDVECYDVDADAWTTKEPTPEGLGEIYPAVLGGKVYVLGGATLSKSDIATPHTQAFAFDPRANTWSPLAPLPSPRGFAAVVPSGGKLYVVGGMREEAKKGGLGDREMLVYDAAANTWSAAPQMPAARVIGFGVDAIGTKGGEIATYFGLDNPLLDRYDAATNTWKNGTEPPETIDPGVYTSVIHDGDIYLLVLLDKIGSKGTSASGKLWKYDAAKDAWSVVGKRSPNERDALFYGTSIGTSLYFVGAFTYFDVSQPSEATPDGGL